MSSSSSNISVSTYWATIQLDLVSVESHSKFISHSQKQKATLRAVDC